MLKFSQGSQCRQLDGALEGVKKPELWSQLFATDSFNLPVAPEGATLDFRSYFLKLPHHCGLNHREKNISV